MALWSCLILLGISVGYTRSYFGITSSKDTNRKIFNFWSFLLMFALANFSVTLFLLTPDRLKAWFVLPLLLLLIFILRKMNRVRGMSFSEQNPIRVADDVA